MWKIELNVADGELENVLANIADIRAQVVSIGQIDTRPPPRTSALKTSHASLKTSHSSKTSPRRKTKPQSRKAVKTEQSVSDGVLHVVNKMDSGNVFKMADIIPRLVKLGHPESARNAAMQKLYKLVVDGTLTKGSLSGSFVKR